MIGNAIMVSKGITLFSQKPISMNISGSGAENKPKSRYGEDSRHFSPSAYRE